MSGIAKFILVILLGSGILFVAAKWGTIGGGGLGANRRENPTNFWLGFSMTAAAVFIAILVLIGSFVQPDHFHLD
jgi:hypothetical protein